MTTTEMDCATAESLVDAYLDGELPVAEALAFEQALESCPPVRHRLADARALRAGFQALAYHRAPAALAASVEKLLPQPARRPATRLDAGWMRMAATILVALGIGWLGGRYLPLPAGGDDTAEIVAGYLRTTMAERPVEVASSDHHTVKPWFSGKIDYAPPVYDLTTDGFPLLGGRIDLIDGRKVAVLVYRRNRHTLALFTWPDAARSAPTIDHRDGFAIEGWAQNGFAFRAVSDLAPDELKQFAAALGARLEADR
jgi:anti-sigma factor RsiW